MQPLPSKPAAMTTPHPDAAADAGDQTWADLLSPARRALLVRKHALVSVWQAPLQSAEKRCRHRCRWGLRSGPL